MNSDDVARLIGDLRSALQARDSLLAIAAHELRNPMQALLLQIGSAGAAAHRQGDAALGCTLDRLAQAMTRSVQRVGLLFEMSRIAEPASLRIERIDLVAAVRAAAAGCENEAAYHGATVRLILPDSLEGNWDRQAVEQIITNLLSNAVRYGAGAPVEVALEPEGGVAARLVVRDHGGGIPPADQARAFRSFQDLVDGRTEAGVGVGLWLARTLAEAHGGSLAIDSIAGRGSAVAVRLPLDPTSAECNRQ